jgi:hypothetical protein
MHDPLDDVLRLVADGRLSPEEAAPIIDALAATRHAASQARAAGWAAADAARAAAGAARAGFESRRPDHAGFGGPGSSGPSGPPRHLRIQVRESGRIVVDLRLPGVLAELAGAVPGIPSAYVDRVREALRTGLRGPIVDVVDEDGSGVTITID